MTPVDLIRLALKTSGVEGIGQTPDSEDVNDCFILLNSILGKWSRQRYLVYNQIETVATTTGVESYTVGPMGDFNTPRPDKISAAYARMLPVINNSPFDFPLAVLSAYEDFAAIRMKQLQSFPVAIFYDSAFPMGLVHVYPVPNTTSFELHLVIKNTLSQFENLTVPISLPPEYTSALIWNLAVELRPLFGLPVDRSVLALASTSLEIIRNANFQPAQMGMPGGLPGSNSSWWPGHGIPNFGNII